MTTTTMTIISKTMTPTGAAMTAALGDSGSLSKLCIRSVLKIYLKNTLTVFNMSCFTCLFTMFFFFHVDKFDSKKTLIDIK